MVLKYLNKMVLQTQFLFCFERWKLGEESLTMSRILNKTNGREIMNKKRKREGWQNLRQAKSH